jgi:hypothetical protein
MAATTASPIIHIHSHSFAVTIVSAAVVLLAYLPSFFYVNMDFESETFQSPKVTLVS